MIKQARSTGGLWFRYGGLQGVIDPGPGSLAHICAAVPPLAADAIDLVMLTHKHLDHSTDVNVLIECMTHGGFDDRGLLVAPGDALAGEDPVVLKYSQKRVSRVAIPDDGKRIELGRGVTAEAVAHIHHGVECFGYIFRRAGLKDWGLISDSRLMPCFAERYAGCRFLSLNATFPNAKSRLDHMSIEEARSLLAVLHPRIAALTHLGAMLTSPEGGHFLTELDTEETHAVAATDGMVVDLDSLEIYRKMDEAPAAAVYEAC